MARSAITGLVVDSGHVSLFRRDSVEACVNDGWAGRRWSGYSVVVFRE